MPSKNTRTFSSQIIDVATSLAKVADDRNLGDENTAISGFEEAIKCLESLKLNSSEDALERKRQSVLEFLHDQLEEKQDPKSPAV